LDGEAGAQRAAVRQATAPASQSAARRLNLKIRFGHDLDPLGGSAKRRHRSFMLHDSRRLRTLRGRAIRMS
jgi:hypothetical protein